MNWRRFLDRLAIGCSLPGLFFAVVGLYIGVAGEDYRRGLILLGLGIFWLLLVLLGWWVLSGLLAKESA